MRNDPREISPDGREVGLGRTQADIAVGPHQPHHADLGAVGARERSLRIIKRGRFERRRTGRRYDDDADGNLRGGREPDERRDLLGVTAGLLAQIDDQHMLGAAQHLEEPQRKTHVVAAQARGVGCTVAGARRLAGVLLARRLAGDRVLHPCTAAIVDQDLGVDETIVASPRPLSERLAGGAGARHHLGADGAALGVVAVEQTRVGGAAQHQRHLPGEVVGVLNAGVHSLPAGGRMDVGGIARDEDVADAVFVGEPHGDAEHR